ncbi:hypothetical protein DFJ73DRAFT_910549 [Zopfochytrium polystomum]|nr:hypothetical protein DFJ73DRAFT_910549 [Zopfochytrium polystomum]
MLLKASLQENLFSPSYYPVVDNARPDVGAARLPPRQGADPNEVDALSEAYFRRRTGLIEVIHKQSFMRDRGTAPAFLQLSLYMLVGRNRVTRTNSVAVYYYDFARSRALDACDSPSLENMQALLILADLSLHVSATSYRPPSPYKPTAVKPICLDEVWLSDDPSAVALIAPQPPDSPFDAYLKIHDIHLGVIRTCTKMNSAPLLLEADFQRLLECGDALGQFSMTIQPDISVEMDSISEWLTTGTTDDVTLPSLVRWRISIFCTYHACTVLLTNRHLLSLRPHSGAHLGDPSSEVDLPRLKLALDKGLDAAAAVAALVSRLNDLSIHCPTLAVVPLFIVAHFLVIADAAEGAPTLATLTPPLPPPLPPSSTRHRTHPRASASAAANPVRDNTRTRDPARTLLAPFVTHFMLGQKIRPSFCVGFRAFSGLCDLGWPGMPSPSSFPPSSSSSRVAAPAAAAAPQPSTSTTSMLASPLSPAASDVVVVGGDNDNDNDDGDGDGDGSRSLLDAAVASWLTAPEMTGRFVGVSAFAPLWRAVRGVGGGGGGGVEGGDAVEVGAE